MIKEELVVEIVNETNKIGCMIRDECHQLSKIGLRPISTKAI